jgi:hypothetical protein
MPRNVRPRGGVANYRRYRMAEDEDVRAACDAIGRRLSTQMTVERELPERLKTLLSELRHQDERAARSERASNR